MEKLPLPATPELSAKVKLYRNANHPHLLGFADLLIGKSFVIRGITIRSGKDNRSDLFVSFPSRKGTGDSNDQYFDIAFPITPEARRLAVDIILQEYKEALKKQAL